jgi:hypothetical protein
LVNIGTISKKGLLEKLKHAYEEGHRVGWDDDRILKIGSKNRHRKYKESVHMACLTNPISQPRLEISSLSAIRLPTHREDQPDPPDSSWVSTKCYFRGFNGAINGAINGNRMVPQHSRGLGLLVCSLHVIFTSLYIFFSFLGTTAPVGLGLPP